MDELKKNQPGGMKNQPAGMWSPQNRFSLAYLLVTIAALWLWQALWQSFALVPLRYDQFKRLLLQGEVKEVLLSSTEIRGLVVRRGAKGGTKSGKERVSPTNASASRVAGSSRPAPSRAHRSRRDPLHELSLHVGDLSHLPPRFLFRTVRVEDPHLVEQLETAGVRFAGVRPSALRQFFWAWILPLLVMGGVWFAIMQVMGKTGQQVMSFGRSRAKIVADRSTGVTFEDVAGCDEAKHDLQELVQFLKDPKRYEQLGARIPTGVLLVGPPGTGKTLLAKAVAGEAGVPFFSLSGSDFVEMFVGVGAARVRDLFEQAKQKAPCIVFIDEIDAIGRQRGVAVGAVNDEREQTLNQLLVEMDGFDANLGVIILAATNRPEVLDRALLRPGRFDRQVIVDTPDLEGRLAILEVHAKGKKLAPDVSLRQIAQATVGFSGADLANTLNEAALLTARRGGDAITQADLEEAVERVVAGPERKSRRLNDEEKQRVAYHEVGHALAAAFSEHADPVHKISIVPRGKAALGYTLQLPTDDRFLVSYSELLDQLKGLLGGRAAEEIVFGEVSTGSQNDLERATALARQMVSLYGMGSSAGLMHCVRQTEGEFLSGPGSRLDCSDATAHAIDQEVKQILDNAYQEALALLRERRPLLDRVAAELLARETLEEADFTALLNAAEEPRQT